MFSSADFGQNFMGIYNAVITRRTAVFIMIFILVNTLFTTPVYPNIGFRPNLAEKGGEAC